MKIKIYGADWCADCIKIKNFLNSKNVTYEYLVITNNEAAITFVEKINKGKRVIPTLDVDGKIYVNPGINELMKIIKI